MSSAFRLVLSVTLSTVAHAMEIVPPPDSQTTGDDEPTMRPIMMRMLYTIIAAAVCYSLLDKFGVAPRWRVSQAMTDAGALDDAESDALDGAVSDALDDALADEPTSAADTTQPEPTEAAVGHLPEPPLPPDGPSAGPLFEERPFVLTSEERRAIDAITGSEAERQRRAAESADAEASWVAENLNVSIPGSRAPPPQAAAPPPETPAPPPEAPVPPPQTPASPPETPASPPEGASPAKSCLHCAKSAGKLLRCSKCQLVHFCSRDCQAAAWPKHRKVCVASPAAKAKAEASASREETIATQLTAQETEIESLHAQGSAALMSAVPTEIRRARRLFVEASELCAARREVLVASGIDGGEIATAWYRQSQLR